MQARPVRRRFNIGKIEVLGLGLADFSLPHKGGGSCICSLPPCGGGLGWGVRTPCLHCPYPPPQPSPTRGEGEKNSLPHKGGGRKKLPPPQGGREKKTPSPTRGEGEKNSLPHKGGGSCICSLPPCGGGLGWGVRTPCLHCPYPPPQPSPTRGEGVVFVPSPLVGEG